VSSSQDETFIVGSTYLLTYCVALLSLLVCVPDLFLDRMSVTNFRDGRDLGQGRGLTGASNAKGYEKMTIFDQYLALSQKRL